MFVHVLRPICQSAQFANFWPKPDPNPNPNPSQIAQRILQIAQTQKLHATHIGQFLLQA